MGNGIFNPKAGGHTDTEQSTEARRNKGAIGSRSNNLVSLIGADNVSRRNFKYEGTYYVTEDGELYGKEYVIAQKVQRTGINKDTLRRHKYQDRFTEETYRTESGIKTALPMYYKQKIWTDQTLFFCCMLSLYLPLLVCELYRNTLG